ncbi:hypothetical protein H8356DRAFT_1438099 [Neocallimastix lanati (nom. inval.)]|nr:hypothetical protein H8356DRAFT_1438319 [Neocallimastix sp. JGI-2020a]KAG4081995.1 hypothetical protein H8356DRAFT_1438093 [Neocallimastix sp. JGI-2020a]KAG4081997.1 hypothetical protein H8356DRAFT_1438095 [Neocallimastix sp. JGI-2020a]KAG4081999.1 hypothetical protein H8356DRAFT_1438097 [Neocallimastix sp. JGI-2020a]KAG4082001.1 hypothetical protein H8356DRAFT_1438099 [Neocallimastix sp. JGI-2020a]
MEQSNRKTKTKLKIRIPRFHHGRVGLRRHVKAVIYSSFDSSVGRADLKFSDLSSAGRASRVQATEWFSISRCGRLDPDKNDLYQKLNNKNNNNINISTSNNNINKNNNNINNNYNNIYNNNNNNSDSNNNNDNNDSNDNNDNNNNNNDNKIINLLRTTKGELAQMRHRDRRPDSPF